MATQPVDRARAKAQMKAKKKAQGNAAVTSDIRIEQMWLKWLERHEIKRLKRARGPWSGY